MVLNNNNVFFYACKDGEASNFRNLTAPCGPDSNYMSTEIEALGKSKEAILATNQNQKIFLQKLLKVAF